MSRAGEYALVLGVKDVYTIDTAVSEKRNEWVYSSCIALAIHPSLHLSSPNH